MQRDILTYDVVIIGAGPAGLASAIRIKQLCQERGLDLSIAVLEKGSSVGAHILSGCVFETLALDELIPNWRELNFPITTPVSQDSLIYLREKSAIRLPHIASWSNYNNYIISLSQLCIRLADYAESLGVEIYPGFPVADYLLENAQVVGVITQEVGRDRDSNPTHNYQAGIEIRARQFIFAEGCRGSTSKKIIEQFHLDAGKSGQTYGLGIKEIWQVDSSKHHVGKVQHFIGHPLNNNAYGGGFLYHLDNNLVAVGLVTSLDYKNPYLSPYEEFQRFKWHPFIKKVLKGGKRLEYGARTVVEGGIQALPKLSFPGGVLIGDSAGFLNVAKIKGVNNAIKSGILAANAVVDAIVNDQIEATHYETAFKQSWLYSDLHKVRNIRPAFRLGLFIGMLYTACDYYLFKQKTPWTFRLKTADHKRLKPQAKVTPIVYGKPDGKITFDKASSVHLANVNHDDGQPCHLKLTDNTIPIKINLASFASPESRYCPAGVYEVIRDHSGQDKFHINAQNCVHCKACDIKDPTQNITWTPPEAGSGPQYSEM